MLPLKTPSLIHAVLPGTVNKIKTWRLGDTVAGLHGTVNKVYRIRAFQTPSLIHLAPLANVQNLRLEDTIADPPGTVTKV